MDSLGLPASGDYDPGNWTTPDSTPTATTPVAGVQEPAQVEISPFPPAPPTVSGVDVTESVFTPGA